MLLSIITVVYNDAKGLSKTISSVNEFASRSIHDVEFIIIDGNSDDASVSMFELVNHEFLSRVICVSESDSGIYDAMNKGLGYVSENSAYCLFMNAGDYFLDNSSNIINSHVFSSQIEVFGIVSRMNGNFCRVRKIKGKDCIIKWPAYPHQSTFISSNLHKSSPYDLKYKILSDYNFFSRAYVNGSVIKINTAEIAVFEQGGASNKISTYFQMVRELAMIQRINFDSVNYFLIIIMGFKVIIRALPFGSNFERFIRALTFGVKK
ncbi:TPA: glycosyltransferase [Aeromonas veronii]